MNEFNQLLKIAMAFLPNHPGLDNKFHYSFILLRNNIESWGYNQPKTHPEAKRLGYLFPSIHSELSAFMNRPKDLDLSKCTFVNIRLSKSSIRLHRPILRMSKPCVYCSPWVKTCGFRDIIYSTDTGFENA